MTRVALAIATLAAGCATVAHDRPAPEQPPAAMAPGASRLFEHPSRSLRRHPLTVRRDPRAPHRRRGLNWRALAGCESGGNPRAISAGGRYRGLYQFDIPTWAAVGGEGDPAAAPPAEQTHRAELLYAEQGRAPWPTCGWLL